MHLLTVYESARRDEPHHRFLDCLSLGGASVNKKMMDGRVEES